MIWVNTLQQLKQFPNNPSYFQNQIPRFFQARPECLASVNKLQLCVYSYGFNCFFKKKLIVCRYGLINNKLRTLKSYDLNKTQSIKPTFKWLSFNDRILHYIYIVIFINKKFLPKSLVHHEPTKCSINIFFWYFKHIVKDHTTRQCRM